MDQLRFAQAVDGLGQRTNRTQSVIVTLSSLRSG